MAWQTLLDMIAEAQEIDQQNRTKIPIECPNDYTALLEGPGGTLYCPWDGFQYPQDA